MSKYKFIFNLIAILTILTATLGNASMVAQAGKGDEPLKADPRLLQMAEENPEAIFMVIVQKDAKNKDLKDVENEVLKGGGQVKKQLDLITSFSAEMTGKELTKLARHSKVRWISPDAPMVSTGLKPGTYTYRDEFNQISFKGSNGTKNWAGTPWMEIGETDGASSGDIEVDNEYGRCVSGYCLELEGDNAPTWGAYRQVNLDGAGSATLSFQYKRVLETKAGSIQVQASSDGGSTWTTLDTIPLTVTDANHQFAQYDLAPYTSASTMIRFIGNEYLDSEIHIDNLEIEFSDPSPYREIVGADKLDITGQGVTVVVVDSGVSDHIDLHQNASNPTQALNSGSRIIKSMVFGDYASPNDEYVHGSHVAGIVAGNGVASGGKYKGIAPGVNLINIRVSNNQGLTYTSDLIDGLQWIYNNKAAYNIRVVNISINSTAPESYQYSPLSAAVEILWFNGIVVVVAAGNNGTADGPSTVYPPANDPFVITVGALEDIGTVSLNDDFVGAFSAYNTTQDGFAKPDIVAPGRNLISLLPDTNATAYTGHLKHRVDNFYFRMSGTSMAAPVVSGVVALLLQDEPGLTPDQVKYRLMATANKSWPAYDAAKAGAGLVDAYTTIHGTTTDYANQGIIPSQMLATGEDAVAFNSVGWNSVGWNSVGWNSVGWNSVGWNSVGWNSVGWNSVGWNSTNWGSSTWDD